MGEHADSSASARPRRRRGIRDVRLRPLLRVGSAVGGTAALLPAGLQVHGPAARRVFNRAQSHRRLMRLFLAGVRDLPLHHLLSRRDDVVFPTMRLHPSTCSSPTFNRLSAIQRLHLCLAVAGVSVTLRHWPALRSGSAVGDLAAFLHFGLRAPRSASRSIFSSLRPADSALGEPLDILLRPSVLPLAAAGSRRRAGLTTASSAPPSQRRRLSQDAPTAVELLHDSYTGFLMLLRTGLPLRLYPPSRLRIGVRLRWVMSNQTRLPVIRVLLDLMALRCSLFLVQVLQLTCQLWILLMTTLVGRLRLVVSLKTTFLSETAHALILPSVHGWLIRLAGLLSRLTSLQFQAIRMENSYPLFLRLMWVLRMFCPRMIWAMLLFMNFRMRCCLHCPGLFQLHLCLLFLLTPLVPISGCVWTSVATAGWLKQAFGLVVLAFLFPLISSRCLNVLGQRDLIMELLIMSARIAMYIHWEHHRRMCATGHKYIQRKTKRRPGVQDRAFSTCRPKN